MTHEYEIGAFVDLSYLNKKREAAPKPAKKSSLYTVGTHFTFAYINNQFKAAISIPVVFA